MIADANDIGQGAMMPSYEPWDPERALTVIAPLRSIEGALLPMLHALQEAFGYIPGDAVPLLAETLNLSRAEVHGVVTFYHDFRVEPPGRRVLKLCRAEACQAAGGVPLADQAERRLAIRFGETTADQKVTLDAVYCLGLCAVAPSAMLDDRLVGRLDATRLDALLVEAQT